MEIGIGSLQFPFSIFHFPIGLSLVAREGFEPSKPLGRQIYSLLRLTASLPRLTSPRLDTRRRLAVWLHRRFVPGTVRVR
jgi:hypothetical protein